MADQRQQYYYEEFNIETDAMKGLMNGAPYLCSALIGCWTNPFLNKLGGRRFTIFISCFVSVVTGIWMAVADSYVPMCLIGRSNALTHAAMATCSRLDSC
jgi:nitrate/nitrite transporter NarK